MVENSVNGRKILDRKQNVMDDITHGQWSKNRYNDNNKDDNEDGEIYYHHNHNDNLIIPNYGDIIDPYSIRKSFTKIAKKLTRTL